MSIGKEIPHGDEAEPLHTSPTTPKGRTKVEEAKLLIERMTSRELETDEESERQYDQIASELISMKLTQNVAFHFADYVTKKWHPAEPITKEDIPSVQIVEHPKELDILEERFGRKRSRPIFSMNFVDFQRFYKKLTGNGGASGFHIRFGKAGMIVCTPDSTFIYHELRHSIDPYLHTRDGENKVLNEFIGFYGDVMNHHTIRQKTTHTDERGNKVTTTQQRIITTTADEVGRKLKTNTHHEQCCPHLTYQEYVTLVDRVSDLLVQLSKRFTELDLECILYHSRTIQNLEEVLAAKESIS